VALPGVVGAGLVSRAVPGSVGAISASPSAAALARMGVVAAAAGWVVVAAVVGTVVAGALARLAVGRWRPGAGVGAGVRSPLF
jgi:hypothetical protein